jgi:hypothetical protein
MTAKATEILTITYVPAETRTEHISNTSLDRYRYENLLGCMVVNESLHEEHVLSLLFTVV